MQRVKFFKKFLMPCGLCASVPGLRPSHPPPDGAVPCSHDGESNLIRPSELPIYTFEECSKDTSCLDDLYAPSALQQGIGEIRRSVQGIFQQYAKFSDKVTDIIDTGIEHSRFALDYLREENHTIPRIGAIGVGGLAGLIFGLRGGRVKRLVYTSSGALGTAAVCYPKQAKESLHLAQHYVNIGYNFVYGVKPGDSNQLEIKFPELPALKLPSSLSDFLDLTINTGTAAVTAIGSLTSAAFNTATSKEGDTSKSDSEPKQQ